MSEEMQIDQKKILTEDLYRRMDPFYLRPKIEGLDEAINKLQIVRLVAESSMAKSFKYRTAVISVIDDLKRFLKVVAIEENPIE